MFKATPTQEDNYRLNGKNMRSERIQINIESSGSILGFDYTVNEWPRHLTVDGNRAYFIGGSCDTCPLWFERLGGANQSVSPHEVSEELRKGLKETSPELVDKISKIVPVGSYVTCLSELTPILVTPGGTNDYFQNEQVALWGIDNFWGLPHHPRTQYYRTVTKQLAKDKILFEFIIPMFPKGWLDAETIEAYKTLIIAGEKPTALSLSVLDVRGPAVWQDRDEQTEISQHWCLAHYLIDGHHKVFASSILRKPITLLSFLAINASIASEENIECMFEHIQR